MLDLTNPSLAAEVREEIATRGGRVLHSYGPRVLIVEGSPELRASLAESGGAVRAYAGPVEDEIPDLDLAGRLGIAAWNEARSNAFREAKRNRRGEGLSWDSEQKDEE